MIAFARKECMSVATAAKFGQQPLSKSTFRELSNCASTALSYKKGAAFQRPL